MSRTAPGSATASLQARASLALARRHLQRARDLADIGINGGATSKEAAALLFVRARAELGLGLACQAQVSAERGLTLGGESAEGHGLAGAAAASSSRWAEAAAGFERALALDVGSAAWHAGAASALLELGEELRAERHARTALALDSESVDAALVLARLALRDGRPADAANGLAVAAAHAPERADVRVTRGVALAAAGDFSTGLREYEWRQQLRGWNPRRFDIPAWEGQALSGKRLLVWSEQGLGDSLQFVRFAVSSRERGAVVIFHGEPRLVRLFRSCGGFDEVHPRDAQRPGADYQASLISLPTLLGVPTEHFAATVPYLEAEPALASAWRARLGLSTGSVRRLRVGLVWQGNAAFCDDERRSMALAHLVPLVREHTPEVEFVSLQKGFGQDQLEFVPRGLPIRDLGSELDLGRDAFVDTAAVLSDIDLVLTTDTSIAHLAGALGRPVWVLLARVPDWRWGVAGDATPWYPSMRLFRQTRAGDWPGVVREVSGELRAWVSERWPQATKQPVRAARTAVATRHGS
jgi:tetratricopeptide (TPR) repeat protein